MRKLTILVLIALLVIPLAVMAQDNPNPGDDNACDDGGLLDKPDGNACTTEWHWVCGWYLQNWVDNGSWTNDNNFFPDWCAPESLLPPRPEEPYPAAGCVLYRELMASPPVGVAHMPAISKVYVNFGGGWSLAAGAPTYSDASCGTAFGTTYTNLVYAPASSSYSALTLCNTAFAPTALASGPSGASIYACDPTLPK